MLHYQNYKPHTYKRGYTNQNPIPTCNTGISGVGTLFYTGSSMLLFLTLKIQGSPTDSKLADRKFNCRKRAFLCQEVDFINDQIPLTQLVQRVIFVSRLVLERVIRRIRVQTASIRLVINHTFEKFSRKDNFTLINFLSLLFHLLLWLILISLSNRCHYKKTLNSNFYDTIIKSVCTFVLSHSQFKNTQYSLSHSVSDIRVSPESQLHLKSFAGHTSNLKAVRKIMGKVTHGKRHGEILPVLYKGQR